MTTIYDGVKREIEDLKAEIVKLKAQIDRLVADRAKTDAENARLKEHIALHAGDTLSLDNDVRLITEQRDEAEGFLRERDALVARLRAELDSTKANAGERIAELLAETARFGHVLEEARNALDATRGEIVRLKEERIETQRVMAELLADITDLNAEIARLQARNS